MTVALKSDLRQIGTMKIGGIGGIIPRFQATGKLCDKIADHENRVVGFTVV